MVQAAVSRLQPRARRCRSAGRG